MILYQLNSLCEDNCVASRQFGIRTKEHILKTIADFKKMSLRIISPKV